MKCVHAAVHFSVITPSYRASPWLKLCIASVADQGVEVEHIVQDGGSDDGTLDWLRGDARVRAFVEKDTGMYDAINRGFRRAKGDILAWLNCDEQYLPGALAAVAGFFDSHPQTDMVFGDIVMVSAAGGYVCHRKVEPPLLYHTWVCHLSTLSCGMFFRRRLIEPGRFLLDATYRSGGDGEWMVRLLRAGTTMACLDQFTSVFTIHGQNLSRTEMARSEWSRLRDTAPAWVRLGTPLWVIQHRLRRWLHGRYRQPPFSFSIYTGENPGQRTEQHVDRPTFRCSTAE